MSKSDKMFDELGFNRNRSECYNDNHVRYEKYDKEYHDITSIEFNEGYYVYTTLHRNPMKTRVQIHLAIHEKLKELGWLDEQSI